MITEQLAKIETKNDLPNWTKRLTTEGRSELNNFIKSCKSEGCTPSIPRNPFLDIGNVWRVHLEKTPEYKEKARVFFGEQKNNQQEISEVSEKIAKLLGHSYYEDTAIIMNIKAHVRLCVERGVLSLEILNKFLKNIGDLDANMLEGLLTDLLVLANELLFQFVEGTIGEGELIEVKGMIGTVSISQLFSNISNGETFVSVRRQFV